MYFLNYLDRNALPQARLNTLEEDLNLKGVEYNTAISILFVGYLLMQSKKSRSPLKPCSVGALCLTCRAVPSNMFMTRTRPSYYLSICMIGWAAVSASTAAVTNYGGLIACRFFLGFVEAVSRISRPQASLEIHFNALKLMMGVYDSLSTQEPCIYYRFTILARNWQLGSVSFTLDKS